MKTYSNPGKSGHKIIHADDHKLFRQLVEKQLNALDEFNVIELVDNGMQLIECINNGLVPDIALLDINMPIMNGYDTTIWLKKHHPAIKIIVFTIFDNDYVKGEILKCGADAFISKNIELKDLGKMINHLMIENVTEKFKNPDSLTERELQLLKLMCTELTYQAIAKEMSISYRLVERTREALFNKFNIHNRTSLVLYAAENGIITGIFK